MVNVARYYHHEIVRVGGQEDDICNNVRMGLDITMATNYKPESLMMSPIGVQSSARKDPSNRKRSSSINAPLPPNKRPCSSSPMKRAESSVSMCHHF